MACLGAAATCPGRGFLALIGGARLVAEELFVLALDILFLAFQQIDPSVEILAALGRQSVARFGRGLWEEEPT